MTADHWARVERLFHGALEQAPESRQAWLQEACAGDEPLRREIEELVAAHGDDDPTPWRAGAQREPSHPAPGTVIDRYRLVRLIGEGGMGLVYEAEQSAPVRRTVALKLLKRGMDSAQVVARFEAERQALALMDHPAIAKVYDAGATASGQPYFVMEYVHGVPINAFCDGDRLTVRARLHLFAQVCDGVQHAHQKAVIHRDLKPSNLLVTYQDGKAVPKIIDFGIAKAIDQPLTEASLHTQVGMLIGTPAYMSPEQASLANADVDTRSDVYALGVVLYELLAGAPPFDRQRLRQASLREVQRIICEEEAQRPSTRLKGLGAEPEAALAIAADRSTGIEALSRSLVGELDWIPLRAMRKEREERYPTPLALAEDCRRYLAGEALNARPPSVRYRVGKFVRRHRTAVVAGLGAVASLVLGLGFALWQAQAAGEARDVAQAALERERAQRERTDRVAEFQGAMLQDFDLRSASMDVRRHLIDSYGRSLAETGLRDADLDASTEVFARNLSRTELSESIVSVLIDQILAPAKGGARTAFAEDPASRAAILYSLAVTYHRLGRIAEGKEAGLLAAELYETAGGYEPEVFRALDWVALLTYDEREYDEAITRYRTLLASPQAEAVAADEIIGAQMNLALPLIELRRFDDARALIDEALAWVAEQGADSVLAATVYERKGLLAAREERFEAGLEGYRQGHEIRARLQGEEHPETVSALLNVGLMHQMGGEVALARSLYEEVIALERTIYGERSSRRTQAMENLAILIAMSRTDMDVSRSLFEEVLAIRLDALGEFHPDAIMALGNLGVQFDLEGQDVRGLEIAERVLAIREELNGPEHPETLLARSNVGELLRQLGRLEEARKVQERNVRDRIRMLGEDARYTLSSRVSLVETLIQLDDYAAARVWGQSLCEATQATFVDDPDKVIWGCANEGFALMYAGDIAAGIAKLRASFDAVDDARLASLLERSRTRIDAAAGALTPAQRQVLLEEWSALEARHATPASLPRAD